MAAILKDESVVPLHHGDGVHVPVEAVPAPLLLSNRALNDEEVSAITWKCRLVNKSRGFIVQMLERLPEACIVQTVDEFRNRTVAQESAVAEQKGVLPLQRRFSYLPYGCSRSSISAMGRV